jgi:nicotinamide-nucleotide amidase
MERISRNRVHLMEPFAARIVRLLTCPPGEPMSAPASQPVSSCREPAAASDDPSILEGRASDLVDRLCKAGLSLATAESCTAGQLASTLSAAPGASTALEAGFVVYTKAAKTMLLGVSETLLSGQGGAVTEPVARAMAEGARDRSPAGLAVAITGVAGPKPDEDDNPVGLAHVACAGPAGTLHRKLTLPPDDRDTLCEQVMLAAIDLVADMLARSTPEREAVR